MAADHPSTDEPQGELARRISEATIKTTYERVTELTTSVDTMKETLASQTAAFSAFRTDVDSRMNDMAAKLEAATDSLAQHVQDATATLQQETARMREDAAARARELSESTQERLSDLQSTVDHKIDQVTAELGGLAAQVATCAMTRRHGSPSSRRHCRPGPANCWDRSGRCRARSPVR
jgi:DNA anti-recombination protein RmuC